MIVLPPRWSVRTQFAAIALIVTAISAAEVQAQLPSTLTITGQYPRSASQAILSESDHTTHSGVPLAFAGLGGQVAVLNVTGQNVGLWTNANDNIYVKGFVHDLAIVRGAAQANDRVYAASGYDGICPVKIGTTPYARENPFDVGDYVRTVAAIDVVDSSGTTHRVVFSGSNEAEAGGVLRCLEHQMVNPPTLSMLGSYPSSGLASAVYSLAVTKSLTGSSNDVTLLAGTGPFLTTTGATIGGSLLRFDIPQAVLNGSQFNLATYLTNSWTITVGGQPGVFVRDIVINETQKVAFVALHGRGIYAFNVQGSGALSPLGSPWPILPTPQGPSGTPSERFDGLALSPDGNYLLAALGPAFMEEQQQWGACSQKTACDGTPNVPGPSDNGHGVRAYRVQPASGAYAAIAKPTDTFSSTLASEKLLPLAVSTRVGPAGYCYVDIAGDSTGVTTKQLDLSLTSSTGGKFVASTTWEGNFAIADNVLLGSTDDVSLNVIGTQSVLYASAEKAVAAFDVSGSSSTLAPSKVVPGSAVTLSVLAKPNSSVAWPSHLVGGTDDGVSIFDLSNPLDPVPLSGLFNEMGHGHTWLKLIESPSLVAQAHQPNQTEPWVWVVNKDESASTVTKGPGVRVWDLMNALAVGNASIARGVATYVDEQSFSGTPVHRTFGGIVVIDLGNSTDQVAYVGYGPDHRVVAHDGSNVADPCTSIGLLALRLQYDPVLGGSSISRVQQSGGGLDVVGQANLTGSEPLGNATNFQNTEVYVAYGCYGVCKYSISPSNGTAGSPAYRAAPPGSSAIQAIRIGSYVFTTYLGSNVVTVEGATNFGQVSNPVSTFHTNFQPLHIKAALSGTDYYGADGRGGLVRFSVQ